MYNDKNIKKKINELTNKIYKFYYNDKFNYL